MHNVTYTATVTTHFVLDFAVGVVSDRAELVALELAVDVCVGVDTRVVGFCVVKTRYDEVTVVIVVAHGLVVTGAILAVIVGQT